MVPSCVDVIFRLAVCLGASLRELAFGVGVFRVVKKNTGVAYVFRGRDDTTVPYATQHIYIYIHIYIHTYIHIYIHTYIHTCIHAYSYVYFHLLSRAVISVVLTRLFFALFITA